MCWTFYVVLYDIIFIDIFLVDDRMACMTTRWRLSPPPVPSTPILSIIRINTRIIENVQTRDHDCGKSSLSASQSLAVGSECSFVIVNYERTRWRYRPYSVPECAERRALLNLAVTHFMCRQLYNSTRLQAPNMPKIATTWKSYQLLIQYTSYK